MSLEHPTGKIIGPTKPKFYWLKKYRKVIIIVIISLVLVIFGLVGGFLAYKHYKVNKNTTKSSQQKPFEYKQPDDYGKNKPSRTIEQLVEAEKKATTTEDKVAIYNEQVAAYSAKGDMKSAISAIQKHIQVDPAYSGQGYYTLAQFYERANDKPNATAYYKKDLDRVKAMSDEEYSKESSFTRQNKITELEGNIKRLGGSL